MKKLFLPLVASLAFALAACGQTSSVTADTASAGAVESAPAVDLCSMSSDAMFGAEALYNVPAATYVTADNKKLLSAATKATVKPLLIDLHSVLLDVRKAYNLRNVTGFCDKLATLRTDSLNIESKLPAVE